METDWFMAEMRQDGRPEDTPAMADQAPVTYRGLVLDRFQADAIAAIKQGHSVLVTAPTGNGKTIIADFVVDQAMKNDRQVVYTAPIKALSNQKFRDYVKLYGRHRVGLVTGDLVINNDAPLRIMTTEILRNILLQGDRPADLTHVIIDEAHFLDDPERGTVWEELLIYLPQEVRILALSATLPNVRDFAEWLSLVREESIVVIEENHRIVPLKLLLANRDTGIVSPRAFASAHKRFLSDGPSPRPEVAPRRRGRGRRDARANDGSSLATGPRHGKRADVTSHLDMVDLVCPDYLPVLYFVFSRKQTEMFARQTSKALRKSLLDTKARRELEDAIARFDHENPGVLTRDHVRMYRKGVAFHHAGLHVAIKALVEELYERRLIQLLYCTSTFALGINMPARSVVFESIRKFNGETVVPLTVRQFQQKAGRAGRRGMDSQGYVIIREDFADYSRDKPVLEQYRRGRYEQISSSFNLSFSSVVNLLHRYTENEIREILDRSFLNFHNRKAAEQARKKLERVQRTIAEWSEQGTAGGGRAGGHRELRRLKRLARNLSRRIEAHEANLIERFRDKVAFLKLAGYLNDDDSFNAGAHALMHIQINEIFVTELLLEGVFEEVDSDELFGILTSIVHELPRRTVVGYPLTGRWSYLRSRILAVKTGDIVTGGSELMGFPVPFCPELMPFGYHWARGEPLSRLMERLYSDTDVSGDLVGAFRRAKDLAGQLRAVFHDDETMTRRLTDLIRRVSRDEVEVID